MATKKKFIKEWSSPSFGEVLNVEVVGDGGTPILFFDGFGTTSKENKLQKIKDIFAYQIENGFNQIYFPAYPSGVNLCETEHDARKRLVMHSKYEEYIIHELVPFIKRETGINSLIIAGTHLGATEASILAFKHPEKFLKLIHVCGPFDIKPYFNEDSGRDVYYNNPAEFIPLIRDENLIKSISCIDIRIVSHQDSLWKDQAYQISDSMNYLQIPHHLDVWGKDTVYNAETMADMLLKHVP